LPTGYGRRAVLLKVTVNGPGVREGKLETLAIYAVDPGLNSDSDRVKAAIRAKTTEKTVMTLVNGAGLYQIKAELFYDLDRLNKFNDATLPAIASTEVQINLK